MHDHALPQITVTEAMLNELAPMRSLSLRLCIAAVAGAVFSTIVLAVMMTKGVALFSLLALPPLAAAAAFVFVALTLVNVARTEAVDGPMIRKVDHSLQAMVLKAVGVPAVCLVVAVLSYAFSASEDDATDDPQAAVAAAE